MGIDYQQSCLLHRPLWVQPRRHVWRAMGRHFRGLCTFAFCQPPFLPVGELAQIWPFSRSICLAVIARIEMVLPGFLGQFNFPYCRWPAVILLEHFSGAFLFVEMSQDYLADLVLGHVVLPFFKSGGSNQTRPAAISWIIILKLHLHRAAKIR